MWKGRGKKGFKEGKETTKESEHKDNLPEISGKEKKKSQSAS